MRILYLHQYFTTPQMSGGTRSYEMARRWAEAGHDVHIVTSERTAAHARLRWEVETLEGITVHRQKIPYRNDMPFWRRIIAFIIFALLAGPRGRRVRPDVVYATSTPLTIAVPAICATVGRKTPLVFEVRDLWPEVPIAMGALANPLTKAAARQLERIAYRRSAHVIALSPGMADGVARTGVRRSQITVAPNACDHDRFEIAESVGLAFRAERQWIADRPFITYCGTFGRANNVGYLVELAAALATLESDAVVGLYGAGMEEQSIRQLAHDLGVLDVNLFFGGEISKEEVPAVLSASTLCTSVFAPIPELEANSANKFFDALAAGRPIAINYGGWQAELIRMHGIGIVLDAADPHASAKAVVEFLAQPETDLLAHGHRAAELGRNLFDRDTITDRVLSVVEAAHAATLS